MTEKKEHDCGCGCLPLAKTGFKSSKPESEKPEKPKKEPKG
jgi:hypothetical protein